MDIHGSIDLVAGRGLRVRKTNAAIHSAVDTKSGTDPAVLSSGHTITYPRIKKTFNPKDSKFLKVDKSPNLGPDLKDLFENMELIEVSKNPQIYDKDTKDNHFDHPIEGDPDFRYDAARIYVTSESEPDRDFGLDTQVGTFDKAAQHKLSEPANDTAPHPLAGSSIATKADHIRIIARQDPKDAQGANKLNGSIRIIKEGKIPSATLPPDHDKVADGERAIIAIEPDGTIYIDAPKIIIGNARTTEPNEEDGQGKGQHILIGGVDAEESVVLGEAFADAILSFAGDVMTAVGGQGVTVPSMVTNIEMDPPTAPAAIANMGGPIMHPAAQEVIDRLHDNLTKALSRVAKTK